MSWISLNAQWAIASGALSFEHKPMQIDDCEYTFDIPINATHNFVPEFVPIFNVQFNSQFN